MTPSMKSTLSASPSLSPPSTMPSTHNTTPVKRTAHKTTPSKQHTTPLEKPPTSQDINSIKSHFRSVKRKSGSNFFSPPTRRPTPTKHYKPLTSGIHQSHGIYSTADDDTHLSDDEKQQLAAEFESFVQRMKTNLTPDKSCDKLKSPTNRTGNTQTPMSTKRKLFSSNAALNPAHSSDDEELLVVR